MIYKRQLLDSETLTSISELVTRVRWVDGLISVGQGGHELKRNFEASHNCQNYSDIFRLLMASVDADSEFWTQTMPIESTKILVSKTCRGGYYNAHHDEWFLGDYSTTVFLNDDYEGGELCIGDQEVKLPAGHAVTYETGIPHLVKPVTSGERHVAVFWTRSMVKDPSIRAICSNLSRAVDLMEPSSPTSFEKAKTDPTFLVRSSLMELKRRYGQK